MMSPSERGTRKTTVGTAQPPAVASAPPVPPRAPTQSSPASTPSASTSPYGTAMPATTCSFRETKAPQTAVRAPARQRIG